VVVNKERASELFFLLPLQRLGYLLILLYLQLCIRNNFRSIIAHLILPTIGTVQLSEYFLRVAVPLQVRHAIASAQAIEPLTQSQWLIWVIH